MHARLACPSLAAYANECPWRVHGASWRSLHACRGLLGGQQACTPEAGKLPQGPEVCRGFFFLFPEGSACFCGDVLCWGEQGTWIGYPNTTGLKAIDYRLTDSLADPLPQNNRYVATLSQACMLACPACTALVTSGVELSADLVVPPCNW